MSEKMRSEFEVAMRELGYSQFEWRGDHYRYDDIEQLWMGFKMGRSSLVIELPPTITAGDVYDATGCDDDDALACAQMVNGAISACGSFIKAKGVGVKG